MARLSLFAIVTLASLLSVAFHSASAAPQIGNEVDKDHGDKRVENSQSWKGKVIADLNQNSQKDQGFSSTNNGGEGVSAEQFDGSNQDLFIGTQGQREDRETGDIEMVDDGDI